MSQPRVKPVQHLCPTCHKIFQGNKNKKYCNNKCSPSYIKRKSQIPSPFPLSSGTVGALAEIHVSADLIFRGYDVFRALSPACYCDVIARKKDIILEIEIRTGHKQHNEKIYTNTKCHPRCKCLAIWDKVTKIVYYLDPETLQEINI